MFLFLLLLLGAVVGSSDRVHMSQVKTITLTAGRQTNSRRVSPVPQLECVGANCDAPKASHPQLMQCTAMGSDGRDMQWKCTADVAVGYKLGRTDVSCEGYENADDEHVLVGSCGVQYDLIKVVEQQPPCKQGPMGLPGAPGPMGPRGYPGEDGTVDTKMLGDMVAAVTRPIICLSVFASLCATALLIACCYSSSSSSSTTTTTNTSVEPQSTRLPIYEDRRPATRHVYASTPQPPPTVIVHEAPPQVIHYDAEPVHHHVRVHHRTPKTTTVYESHSPRSPSPERHTSTGYGTTKRR